MVKAMLSLQGKTGLNDGSTAGDRHADDRREPFIQEHP
jgi:hypothetical protein